MKTTVGVIDSLQTQNATAYFRSLWDIMRDMRQMELSPLRISEDMAERHFDLDELHPRENTLGDYETRWLSAANLAAEKTSIDGGYRPQTFEAILTRGVEPWDGHMDFQLNEEFIGNVYRIDSIWDKDGRYYPVNRSFGGITGTSRRSVDGDYFVWDGANLSYIRALDTIQGRDEREVYETTDQRIEEFRFFCSGFVSHPRLEFEMHGLPYTPSYSSHIMFPSGLVSAWRELVASYMFQRHGSVVAGKNREWIHLQRYNELIMKYRAEFSDNMILSDSYHFEEGGWV
jgi:hypothetical protein